MCGLAGVMISGSVNRPVEMENAGDGCLAAAETTELKLKTRQARAVRVLAQVPASILNIDEWYTDEVRGQVRCTKRTSVLVSHGSECGVCVFVARGCRTGRASRYRVSVTARALWLT